MSIVKLESFDYYGVNETFMSQNDWATVSRISLYTATQRTGNTCMSVNRGSNTISLAELLIGQNMKELIVGFGAYLDNLPDNQGTYWYFRDVNGTIQLTCVVNTDGTIIVQRGPQGGTVLGTSDISLPRIIPGSWNYFETHLVIDDTVGFLELRINNVVVLTLSGIDTKNTSLDTCSRIGWMCVNVAGTNGLFLVDDLYIVDPNTVIDANNPCTDYLGDIRVYTLFPEAPGASSDWTAVGSTPNWSCVDEVSPDDDSTYVQSSTVGNVDSYQMQNLDPTITGVVRGVMLVTRARKTDSGPAAIRSNIRSGSGSNTVANGDQKDLSTAYAYYRSVFHVDPESTDVFSLADIDALQTQVETVV